VVDAVEVQVFGSGLLFKLAVGEGVLVGVLG